MGAASCTYLSPQDPHAFIIRVCCPGAGSRSHLHPYFLQFSEAIRRSVQDLLTSWEEAILLKRSFTNLSIVSKGSS